MSKRRSGIKTILEDLYYGLQENTLIWAFPAQVLFRVTLVRVES